MSLRLDFCSAEAARYAVERWYYRPDLPRGKVVRIGVWEKDQFCGVVLFGMGASADLGTRWGLTCFECCEMVRVAIGAHNAPTSRIVAIALRLLRKHSPGIRAVVSYSDPGAGHVGTIYQAMNWVYCGKTAQRKRYVGPDGTEYHDRQVSPSGFKTTQGRRYAVPRPQDLTAVRSEGKHRYVYPLDEEMRERLKQDAQPFPKKPDAPEVQLAARAPHQA